LRFPGVRYTRAVKVDEPRCEVAERKADDAVIVLVRESDDPWLEANPVQF
jgi:hypothetical protein